MCKPTVFVTKIDDKVSFLKEEGGIMQITEVRIFLRNEDRLKAYASITFDDAFVVRNLKVIRGNKDIFVAMPNRKTSDGSYKDVAHPINNEMRNMIETKVLEAYRAKVAASPDAATIRESDEFDDEYIPESPMTN